MIEHWPSSPEEYARQDTAALVGYLLNRGVNYEDARDAAGEAITRMVENWATIDNPRAWARTTAYRIAVDEIRRHRAEDAKTQRAGARALTAAAAVDDLWMLKEEQRAVIGCIRALPPAQSLVLALHLDGFTNTEIAEIIGSNVQTVRSNLRHAKHRLETVLQAEGVYRPAHGVRRTDGGE
jgi:RNA polymerase sigma-70 factor (ECF subfamily)